METQRPQDPTGGDVLVSGSERAPWRPAPRQKLAALAVALVVAVGALVADQVRDVRREKALDRAALAEIAITVEHLEPGENSGPLMVFNGGTRWVQLMSVTLDVTAFGSMPVELPVIPGGSSPLELHDGRPCEESRIDETPRELVLTLRTDRGDTTTRRFPLSAWMRDSLVRVYNFNCGFRPADEAFVHEISGMRRVPRGVEITYHLGNFSVLPLTVQRVTTVPAGVRVTGLSLPTSLQPATAPGASGEPVVVRVTLTADDCRAMARHLADPEVGGLGGIGLSLTNRRGTAEAFLDLNTPNNGLVDGEFDVDARLLGVCGIEPRY